MDVSEFDVRRTHPFEAGTRFLESRVTEVLGKIFSMPWPQRQYRSARGVRRSPLHPMHLKWNAVFGQERGWEIPHFYAPKGSPAEYEYSFEGGNWLAPMGAEMEIAHSGVGLVDLSHSSKVCVSGSDAVRLLDRLICSTLPDCDGAFSPALMLNERGGIHLEVTVQRVASENFLVLSGASSQVKLKAWLEQNAEGLSVSIVDQTSSYASFALVGPGSRELLATMGIQPPAPGRFEEEFLGHSPVRFWTTQLDRLDVFQFLISTEFAASAVELLESTAVKPVGLLAWSALQFEIGIPAHERDYGNVANPQEAGLAHMVDRSKDCNWIGRDTLHEGLENRPSSFVAAISLDESEVYAYGTEPVLVGGNVVSYLSSARYIPSLRRSVGFASLPTEYLDQASVVVEVGNRKVPATVRRSRLPRVRAAGSVDMEAAPSL